MNLTKLFEMQAQLDADIMANHPVAEGEDRFGKKVLALLVELGELGQCWRGFKFWSKDQQARTKELIECNECGGTGDELWYERYEYAHCETCNGAGGNERNLLLEEYVDCLHFLLSIGNDWGMADYYSEFQTFNIGGRSKREDAQTYFMKVFEQASVLQEVWRYTNYDEAYNELLSDFATLGDALGLHEDEIEQAYYDKNKENFARQARGY